MLTDWLDGYGVPFVDDANEPFVWVQRGLSLLKDHPNARVEFIKRIATVLRSQPDVNRPGSQPQRVLYNLFMICAWLRSPHEIGIPLKDILDRQRAINDKWFSLELRSALRTALIENQFDESLRPIWEEMLSGGGDWFLPGNEFDGYEGIIRMPVTPNASDALVVKISRMIQTIGAKLERGETVQSELRFLIEKAVQAYGGSPGFDERFLRKLEIQQLAPWIRTLTDRLTDSPQSEKQAFITKSLLPLDQGQYDVALRGLLDEIEAIKRGRTNQSKFEDWVGRVIRLCLFRALTNLESQKRDFQGRVRRDWIAANRAPTGFWEMVRARYGATQIIFECKNYRRLAANDFHQLAYYMTKPLGRFGVLVFRGEIANHYYGHIKRIAEDKDGMILLIREADMKIFVQQSLNDKVEESYLQDIYDRTIRKIS